MEFERYEDVIDAYERDNMGYATLTDYIKGENIKIKEIEMDPLGDLQAPQLKHHHQWDLETHHQVVEAAEVVVDHHKQKLKNQYLNQI